MGDEVSPAEAARALADIQLRQQQVIDLAMIPAWYWWAVGALMVVLALGVDSHSPVVIGLTVPVFMLGMLAATGWVVSRAFRHAQLRNGLIDGRAVVSILGFVALIVVGTIGLALGLRAAGVGHPATLACVAGGLVMGAGGPVLMRRLRAIMLGNRTGAAR
jgi:hypothetical protein